MCWLPLESFILITGEFLALWLLEVEVSSDLALQRKGVVEGILVGIQFS